MKVRSIDIQGVAGIKALTLAFDDHMNILCGPNGIGKTTILECIAHSFARIETPVLKRNVSAKQSFVTTTLDDNRSTTLTFDAYEPNIQATVLGFGDLSKYLLSLKTTRTFSYQQLGAVSKDSEKLQHQVFQDAVTGVQLHDIKNWFVNRHLFSPHLQALTPDQQSNFALAKSCFSFLDDRFKFSHVDASSLEIVIDSPTGRIYYEYLSSGFKSTVSILFSIIKEIEFRFPNTSAAGFNGVVVLDEIELHLHPAWQSRLAKVLTEVFPQIQFIVTTHSPHVIQAAEWHEIIALEVGEGGIEVRKLPNSEYGFKGWTVDEVLTEVMGMEDTRTEFFNNVMATFEKAVDQEDKAQARIAFDKLDVALHPRNPLRKLLSLQLAGLGNRDD